MCRTRPLPAAALLRHTRRLREAAGLRTGRTEFPGRRSFQNASAVPSCPEHIDVSPNPVRTGRAAPRPLESR